MLQYLIAGIVTGGIYAIASTGLVVTFMSSGILNFAYAAMAYFIARTYYFLYVQHNWNIALAAVVCIFVIGPALGLILWILLFRYLSKSTTLIKVVGTVGVSVTLPAVAVLIYGDTDIISAPGLVPPPGPAYHVLGVGITLDQVIVLASVVVLLLAGSVILRFTNVGLAVRAIVDSPALASTMGVNPGIIEAAVTATTAMIAGLVGIMIAPIIGLDIQNYTILIASAFAAVLLAGLTRVGRAVVYSLLIGIASALIQFWSPPTTPITGGLVDSVPFIFIVIYLVYQTRRGTVVDADRVGGALDQAIAPPVGQLDSDESEPAPARSFGRERGLALLSGTAVKPDRIAGGLAGVVIVGLLLFELSDFWSGLVGEGICFGVIFLSFTLVTGEGGMIWLCEVSFAGVGGVMTAYLSTSEGWPILAALVVSALIVAPAGILIGYLTTRLGDLYVALVTLTFGVLMDNLIFPLNAFSVYGNGLSVGRPGAFSGARAFGVFALVIFVLLALFIENLRRSTAGLGVVAVRWSARGSETIGINGVAMKILTATLAACIAALGGGLLTMSLGIADPTAFDTFSGLAWLAVLVTIGVRSNTAALVAGLIFVIMPAIFQNYLPLSLAELPTALFGLGAIMLARNPDGVVAMHARQVRGLAGRVLTRQSTIRGAVAQ